MMARRLAVVTWSSIVLLIGIVLVFVSRCRPHRSMWPPTVSSSSVPPIAQ